jgi:hypothetical protein
MDDPARNAGRVARKRPLGAEFLDGLKIRLLAIYRAASRRVSRSV